MAKQILPKKSKRKPGPKPKPAPLAQVAAKLSDARAFIELALEALEDNEHIGMEAVVLRQGVLLLQQVDDELGALQ